MQYEPIAWLRDLDGTGSLHVCSEGDPGAIAVYEYEDTASPDADAVVEACAALFEVEGARGDWDAVSIASAIRAIKGTFPADDGALVEAARDVIASASDTYNKRNGHLASFQDDSGEKCWIVPFDAFEALRSAIPSPPSAQETDHDNG